MREPDIIAKYLRPLADNDYARGLLDDAAYITLPPGDHQVMTTDMLYEGVHFLPNMSAKSLAYRALAVNVSDLAAMGATPLHYQLGLGLAATQEEWIADFCDGLQHAQHAWDIALSGGDTIAGCHALVIAITACGVVRGEVLGRTGAQVGDVLYVSGTLGDAMLGLYCLQHRAALEEEARRYVVQRFERPSPRVALGQALRGVASACMDISDGIMLDCQKLCAASHVGAQIAYDALPLSDAMARVKDEQPDMFRACISGGDDYELLFTAPEHYDVLALQERVGVRITAIGRMVSEQGVTLADARQREVVLDASGYEHVSV